MKYKIYYTINEFEDNYILEGEVMEDIQKQNEIEMGKRGLNWEKNNCHSVEIKE